MQNTGNLDLRGKPSRAGVANLASTTGARSPMTDVDAQLLRLAEALRVMNPIDRTAHLAELAQVDPDQARQVLRLQLTRDQDRAEEEGRIDVAACALLVAGPPEPLPTG